MFKGKRSQIVQYFTKLLSKKLNKNENIICFSTYFLINHLTTPRICMMTLWSFPTPRLGTSGLSSLKVMFFLS